MSLKKELTENLKKMLNSDEEFRDSYNKLSDEEKNNIKNRFLESYKLHNLIFENHKPYRMDSLETEATEKLRNLLLAKGYKKPHGKKARLYSLNRAFIFSIDKYLVAVKPTKYDKKGAECSFLIMLGLTTERGAIYVDLRSSYSNENDLAYSAYTAHFFDRYKERLGLEGSRESIVKIFMKKELTAVNVGSSLEYQGEKVIYNLSNGLALGIASGEGILLKTFISENEINSFQERKKQELDEMMLLNDLEFLQET